MKMNRREAFSALSAFALMGVTAEVEAQTGGAADVTSSRLYKYADIAVTHNPAGAAGRAVPNADLPKDEFLGVHLTTIEPGKEFAPLHKNANHEYLFVHEGRLELVLEGKPTLSGEVGDILFAAANEMHTTRNPGKTPVTYFVTQIKGPVAAANS